jgi:hypothetical protein
MGVLPHSVLVAAARGGQNLSRRRTTTAVPGERHAILLGVLVELETEQLSP